jgi:hypothetical protein
VDRADIRHRSLPRLVLRYHATAEVATDLIIGAGAVAGFRIMLAKRPAITLPVQWLIGAAVIFLTLLSTGNGGRSNRCFGTLPGFFGSWRQCAADLVDLNLVGPVISARGRISLSSNDRTCP